MLQDLPHPQPALFDISDLSNRPGWMVPSPRGPLGLRPEGPVPPSSKTLPSCQRHSWKAGVKQSLARGIALASAAGMLIFSPLQRDPRPETPLGGGHAACCPHPPAWHPLGCWWHPGRLLLLPPIPPQTLEGFGLLPSSASPSKSSALGQQQPPKEGRSQHTPRWGPSKTPPILPAPHTGPDLSGVGTALGRHQLSCR